MKSLPINLEAVSKHYPSDEHVEDRQTLTSIIKVFSTAPESLKKYSFYIEKKALEKFLKHVNSIYDKNCHEATGLFVGYYLHSVKDESKKIAVATNFLPSNGSSTVVTCEISYEDASRNAAYCQKHKTLALAQGHSHPFKGHVPRFSSVDYNTLKHCWAAPHQMAFVCNPLTNEFAGYKMIDGEPCYESLYTFDLEKSLENGEFKSECLYKPIVKTRKQSSSSIKKEPDNATTKKENAENNNFHTVTDKAKKLLWTILILQCIQLALMLFPYILAFDFVSLTIQHCFIEILSWFI